MAKIKKVKKIKNPHQFLLDSGLLFTINHQILSPFGLVLAINLGDNQEEDEMSIDGIWDYRDNPEGIIFDNETFIVGSEKFQKFMDEFGEEKLQKRHDVLGYIHQPHPDEIKEEKPKRKLPVKKQK